ncbi:MAG: argininosuccinate lyase [Candidatus Omnitrophota bacterium]|nr:argininosuccinate lyase [Candidatus Omnitrophota bacterium]
MSKLWGGRFSKDTDKLVEEFTKSIHFDYKLGKYDVLGSMCHVEILKNAGYLTPEEYKKLTDGLDEIYEAIEKNEFQWDSSCEDVHSAIQKELEKRVGELVQKLHTARSRNDQVVFATKLYCKITLLKLQNEISRLAIVIGQLALNNKDIIIPGFTHLQHAQPVYLKDYLWAYVEMLESDANRLEFIEQSMKITMGAGALAGSPLDAKYNEKASEFLKGKFSEEFKIEVTTNAIHVVSDRDFVIEIISALSIVAMHLSRLSEDLIIWCTKEFDFIELDDAFCTGSSLMPQKKNPDVLELVRGYSGRLYGNLVSVLTMMKGLPLTYNRDMQLDKEPLFNSFEIVFAEVKVLKGLIETLKFNEKKIEKHLEDESLYATDLVYYLVNKGVPFKEAHTIIGELVRYSVEKNLPIKQMPEDYLKEKFSEKIVQSELIALFDPKTSVDSKKSVKRSDYGKIVADALKKNKK